MDGKMKRVPVILIAIVALAGGAFLLKELSGNSSSFRVTNGDEISSRLAEANITCAEAAHTSPRALVNGQAGVFGTVEGETARISCQSAYISVIDSHEHALAEYHNQCRLPSNRINGRAVLGDNWVLLTSGTTTEDLQRVLGDSIVDIDCARVIASESG